MTQSHRWYVLVLTILLASVLCSCASVHSQQQFAMSFLPAPLPANVEADLPTSGASSGLYANSMPNLVQKSLPAIEWPTEVDSRVIKADERFEAGKRKYQRGDLDGARRDFNTAIDALLTAPQDLPNRQKLERKLDQLVDKIYRYDLEELGSEVSRLADLYRRKLNALSDLRSSLLDQAMRGGLSL